MNDSGAPINFIKNLIGFLVPLDLYRYDAFRIILLYISMSVSNGVLPLVTPSYWLSFFLYRYSSMFFSLIEVTTSIPNNPARFLSNKSGMLLILSYVTLFMYAMLSINFFTSSKNLPYSWNTFFTFWSSVSNSCSEAVVKNLAIRLAL